MAVKTVFGLLLNVPIWQRSTIWSAKSENSARCEVGSAKSLLGSPAGVVQIADGHEPSEY